MPGSQVTSLPLLSTRMNRVAGNVMPFSGLRLQCTRCGTDMEILVCPECGFQMRVADGITHALPPERTAHYARFIAEYERIRAAEGRGSQSEEYYFSLPYKDVTGNNEKQWKVRARSFDYLVRHVLKPFTPGGRILDLGAGNCWMSYRLTLLGYRPIAVDLLTNAEDGLRAGDKYRSQLPEALQRFQAEAAKLPFQDRQFDAVVFNASFHYSEDYEATLHEALRCLKSGGRVVVTDTPWYAKEESGEQMIAERHALFCGRYGTASDSIKSLEYLTDDRLHALEKKLSIRWTIHSPWYGVSWAMRPLLAKLRRRRIPSRFRIYVATRNE